MNARHQGSLLAVASAISRVLGTGEVGYLEGEDYTTELMDGPGSVAPLQLDMRFSMADSIFEALVPQAVGEFNETMAAYDASSPVQPGFGAAAATVVSEFLAFRGLKPLKFCVAGPAGLSTVEPGGDGDADICEGWFSLAANPVIRWQPAGGAAAPEMLPSKPVWFWVASLKGTVVRERPWGSVITKREHGALLRGDLLQDGWLRLEEDFVRRGDEEEGHLHQVEEVGEGALEEGSVPPPAALASSCAPILPVVMNFASSLMSRSPEPSSSRARPHPEIFSASIHTTPSRVNRPGNRYVSDLVTSPLEASCHV